MKAHHVQITVQPEEEAAAHRFYCQLLGLPEIPKPAELLGRGGFWLQAGLLQIHVGVEDFPARNKTKAHIAYEVADLGSVRRQLEGDGIVTVDGVPVPGYLRAECRDPFGNRIEFLQGI